MSNIKEKKEYVDLLKKPVNTLAIVPQNKRITVLGRKLYNVMLCIAQEQGIKKEMYRILLSDIVTGLDYGSNDVELLKKHLRSMVSTVVEWQSPTVGEGSRWSVCALIAYAEIVKLKGQNWVEWSYAKPLKQELLEPLVFAKLSLNIISQMRTYAGVVLYEICTRYKAIGRTSRQNWRWWHLVLSGQPNLEKLDKLEKLEYRFFKRDTLKPALAEVCTVTDIEIEIIEHKEGKFITDIQFIVHQKSPTLLPQQSIKKPIDLSVVDDAKKLGLKVENIESLLSTYGDEAVRIALKGLEKRLVSSYPEPLRDPYRYIKAMLTNNLSKHPSDEEIQATIGANIKVNESLNKSAWNDEWIKRRKLEVIKLIDELSEDAMNDLVLQFNNFLVNTNAHPSLIKRLKLSGWQHPMVKYLMIDYYAIATIGEYWNTPSPSDLLDIASQICNPQAIVP